MLTFEAITATVEGVRVVFVVPTIPDDAPALIREAIARRRIATIDGTCPCGATRPALSRQVRRRAARTGSLDPARLAIEHEDDCPALAENEVLAWAYLREMGQPS